MILIIVLAIIGFCMATYTYYVDRKLKVDPTYKPMCDISDKVSCSKVAQSKYAYLFYFSNAVLAMAYYIVTIILAALNLRVLLLITAIASCLVSLFFAYILGFRLKIACPLCIALYAINFLILFLLP
jgi:vitamin-K-epoxide reductase (warfarin-sensitive)